MPGVVAISHRMARLFSLVGYRFSVVGLSRPRTDDRQPTTHFAGVVTLALVLALAGAPRPPTGLVTAAPTADGFPQSRQAVDRFDPPRRFENAPFYRPLGLPPAQPDEPGQPSRSALAGQRTESRPVMPTRHRR